MSARSRAVLAACVAGNFGATAGAALTQSGIPSGCSASCQCSLTCPSQKARFNFYMVRHDGSLRMHNPNYVPFLLADANTKVSSQFTLANFSAKTTVGWTNLTIAFPHLGTGLTGYSWDFGDGNTSTSANPTYAYTNPGLYAVTFTGTSASGTETLTRPNYISVYVKPVPDFTADPTSGTAPLTVTFTNLTTVNVASVTGWRWTLMGGVSGSPTSSEVNPVFTYTNAGTYNISLRATTPAGNITTTSNAFITVTAP